MNVRLSGFLTPLAATLVMCAGPWAAKAYQEPPPVVRPATIVILVDESGSISNADLVREREAAATIALGEYAPRSTISVVGFGSSDGPGQSAVDVVCPPVTVTTAEDQQRLADCTGNLRKRGPGQGQGTDHAAALRQAMSYMGDAKPDGPRMIFLLTDGELDVSGSPAYGPDNVGNQRNAAAWTVVDDTLNRARAAQTQVWPLGFGTVNKAALDRFAEGGFAGACGPKAPKPAAVVVSSAADVDQQLLRAYSAARCAGTSDLQQRRLSPGSTESMTVDIPSIATDGSIVVVKHDPGIAVSFKDPHGVEVPKSGARDGSTFQGSGQNGPVEALRIVNPTPGKWTVTLTSFPAMTAVDVTAVVIWQGAVRAVLTVDPPSPQPGQTVTVSLKLQTRNQVVTDQLSTLDFTVTMAGAPVAVADDGRQPDRQAGDGIYTGVAQAPATGASVQFTGTVTGVGVSGDTRTYDAALSTSQTQVRAQIKVDAATTVEPGKAVQGTVTVTSALGRAVKLRLQVTDPGPGTKVSVPGEDTILDVPPTGNTDFAFRLLFAPDTGRGPNTMVLKVVQDADDSQVLTLYPFTVDVDYPPPVWLYVAVPTALALAAVLWLARRSYRRARDVRGLAVYLYENGRPRGDIAAPEKAATSFSFAVRTGENTPPYLDEPVSRADPDRYELRRVGGRLTVLGVHIGRSELLVGSRVPIASELEIEVHDERATAVPAFAEPGHDESPDPVPPNS
ncbi:vWA domain-containing protein [Actinocrispum wychmicini]|uniref:vWA domain-containing protein n=1 Tax=Actinocrispum wychmicini TaxID=1213861 RepID=UPI00140547F7|nr:vWA domain-containing protein [Actinocrispum wychmicini]